MRSMNIAIFPLYEKTDHAIALVSYCDIRHVDIAIINI